VRPEEALETARARAAAARAEGAYADDLTGFTTRPTDRVGTETLMEWAVIEPDPDLMRSTRRLGAPVTFLKRLLLRGLQQQFNELTSQESRFHMHLLVHIAELEDRVAQLEELAATREERGRGEAPDGPAT
jgi:hypothetical protein